MNAAGETRRVYEAGLRSGWDTYRGAVEAALAGDVGRLVDCLRGRKPFTADDRDRLTRYVATKLRRRIWPDWLVDALCRRSADALTDDDYDRLAGQVEQLGLGRGRAHDDLVHRTARLVDVLLFDRRVSDWMRSVIIAYALVITSNETGWAAPLLLVRREESDEAKAPWPPVQRMASDEVNKVLSVAITDGYVIVGKEPGTPIDPDWVADLLVQVRGLFNRPKARRH
jgi:hypothetical protein